MEEKVLVKFYDPELEPGVLLRVRMVWNGRKQDWVATTAVPYDRKELEKAFNKIKKNLFEKYDEIEKEMKDADTKPIL